MSLHLSKCHIIGNHMPRLSFAMGINTTGIVQTENSVYLKSMFALFKVVSTLFFSLYIVTGANKTNRRETVIPIW